MGEKTKFAIRRHQRTGVLVICFVSFLLIFVGATLTFAQGPPSGPPSPPGDSTFTPTPHPNQFPPAPVPPPSSATPVPGPDIPVGDITDFIPNPEGYHPQSSPHARQLTENGIIKHAATPVQLSVAADGLQYYFIGADGSSVTGPHIPSFMTLKINGVTTLFSGTNPLTGKPVMIDYLPVENMIRVSTFYPDNEYDTNKPYIFRFGSDHTVIVEAW